jgi:hypothetical protein
MLTTRRCRHDEGPPWCRAARLPQATLVTPLERIAGGPDDPEARLCSASKIYSPPQPQPDCGGL